MDYSKEEIDELECLIEHFEDILSEVISVWKEDRENTLKMFENSLNFSRDYKTDFKINEFEKYYVIVKWFLDYCNNLHYISSKSSLFNSLEKKYFISDDLDYQIKNMFESAVNGQIYFPDSFCSNPENFETVTYWSFSQDEIDFMKYILKV